MPDTDTKTGDWAVVGGGMLGLTIALRLAQNGNQVTVFEAATEIGGLTATMHFQGLRWDAYYHVLSATDDCLLSLLDELGLTSSVRWRRTKTNFYGGRELYPLNNVFDYLRLPILGPVDKMRLAFNIVYAGSINDGAKLESITAERWLSKWSGKNTYDRLWRPLLKSKLGDNLDKASAAYIWSIIKRFYGARHGAKKTEQFGYIEGGYGRVVDALKIATAKHHVEIKTGMPVNSIERRDRQQIITTPTGSATFDNVVFTGASKFVAEICNEIGERDRELHDGIAYQGVICSSVLLTKPLAGAYMTYITDDEIPFTTVIEMSALTGTEPYGGLYLCYLPKYVPANDAWFNYSDTEVESRFLNGLYRMFPDLKPQHVVTIRTARTRHVLAVPTLDYSANLPSTATPLANLFVCNSAQIVNAALAVNESIELAEMWVKTQSDSS